MTDGENLCYHDSVAQLIVRNLENDVRDRLRVLAEKHGHSMEEEVREILRAATLRASIGNTQKFGARLAARFRRHGLTREIEELRGESAKPADFES